MCTWFGLTVRRPSANGPSTDGIYGSRHLAGKWSADGTAKRLKALINVDMIGDKDLEILQEMNSSAPVRRLVWQVAADLGYSANFPNEQIVYRRRPHAFRADRRARHRPDRLQLRPQPLLVAHQARTPWTKSARGASRSWAMCSSKSCGGWRSSGPHLAAWGTPGVPVLGGERAAFSKRSAEFLHREADFRALHFGPDVLVEESLRERFVDPGPRTAHFHVRNAIPLHPQ